MPGAEAVRRRLWRFVRLLAILALCGGFALPHGMGQSQGGGEPKVEVLTPVNDIPAKERTVTFLDIVNRGPGNITDLKVVVRPSAGSGLVIIGQTLHTFDVVEDDEGAFVVLRLATGDQPGGAGIILELSYRDASGTLRTATREVTLQVGPRESDPLDVAIIDPAPIRGGSNASVRFEVRNPTDRWIRELDLDLVVASPAISGLTGIGSQLSGFGTTPAPFRTDLAPAGGGTPLLRGAILPPFASLRVDAEVLTSLSSQDLLLLTLDARYALEGFERNQRFDFGARIAGDVRLRLLEAQEERVGDRYEVSGTLVNVGTGTAWNPQVRIASGGRYAETAPRLVEDLEPNDPAGFRIPMSFSGNGSELHLVVAWNDEYGDVHESTVNGNATFLQPEGPTRLQTFQAFARSLPGIGTFLVIAAVAFVIGVMAYIRHKRA